MRLGAVAVRMMLQIARVHQNCPAFFQEQALGSCRVPKPFHAPFAVPSRQSSSCRFWGERNTTLHAAPPHSPLTKTRPRCAAPPSPPIFLPGTPVGIGSIAKATRWPDSGGAGAADDDGRLAAAAAKERTKMQADAGDSFAESVAVEPADPLSGGAPTTPMSLMADPDAAGLGLRTGELGSECPPSPPKPPSPHTHPPVSFRCPRDRARDCHYRCGESRRLVTR